MLLCPKSRRDEKNCIGFASSGVEVAQDILKIE